MKGRKTEEWIEISKHFTIGKNKNPKQFIKNFERIGGIDVTLLKGFLKHIPKDATIGVYVTKQEQGRIRKGDLAPLHSHGWFLAPTVAEDSEGEFK